MHAGHVLKLSLNKHRGNFFNKALIMFFVKGLFHDKSVDLPFVKCLKSTHDVQCKACTTMYIREPTSMAFSGGHSPGGQPSSDFAALVEVLAPSSQLNKNIIFYKILERKHK